MQKPVLFSKPLVIAVCTTLVLAVILVGCSSTGSDAVRIIQSNADGTIAALNSQLGTAQATLVIVDTLTTQLAAAQSDLETVHAQLISQINAPTAADLPTLPPPVGTPQPGGNAAPLPNAPTAAVTTPSPVLVIDTPVMAKSIDANGCPVNAVTTFSTTDQKIWIIAKVHNLKKGTTFTASWSGSITHTDTWTSTYNAPQLCVHFYVQPQTLNMGAGNWTASLSVADLQPVTASFSIQDVASLQTSAATG